MTPAEVFGLLEINTITSETFDELVLANEGLTGVFFWGENCPNCEIAKASLVDRVLDFRELGVAWFETNVYEHRDLGTRFGLHGIPAFIFFRDGKKLGRISPYPGFEPFAEAIRKL